MPNQPLAFFGVFVEQFNFTSPPFLAVPRLCLSAFFSSPVPSANMPTPAVMRRLMRELTELQTNPSEGIRVSTAEDNMLDVTGIIQGPEGTPYAGGYFRVKFKFTEEFPAAPPKCWFATKIFHPNVGPTGEICVNTLKKDWKSEYGIGHILVTVKCLLIYPNPESALDEEAGKLLLENYDDYCSRARLITSVHATPRVPPSEFDAPSADEDAKPSTSKGLAKAAPPASSKQPVTTFITPSSSTSSSKPLSSGPLQVSPSNFEGTGRENAGTKLPNKDRHTSPAPLAPTDSNVAPSQSVASENKAAAPTTKAVKRTAASANSGAEKRKKALKRL
ncbi:ubiquitin-conjugating enzyme E2 [Phanerochaete sordida]|uniref:E2 ubiquitin-conjugating enzyme n=1 Tax=Phanerochaete sordida TaxID=48140 RepID=A0A9P3LC33_9APHY|nr:ubiquitin-conjugating enzyme E2 [Phanerochaete sordida]